MRHIVLVAVLLPGLAGCVTHRSAASDRSVDAVVQDEGQRQKVLAAIHSGVAPDKAMDKVADGPKQAQPTPAQAAPK